MHAANSLARAKGPGVLSLEPFSCVFLWCGLLQGAKEETAPVAFRYLVEPSKGKVGRPALVFVPCRTIMRAHAHQSMSSTAECAVYLSSCGDFYGALFRTASAVACLDHAGWAPTAAAHRVHNAPQLSCASLHCSLYPLVLAATSWHVEVSLRCLLSCRTSSRSGRSLRSQPQKRRTTCCSTSSSQ